MPRSLRRKIFFPRSITREVGYSAKAPPMSAKAPIEFSHMESPPISPGPSIRRHGHHRRPSSPISPPRSPPSPRMATTSSSHYRPPPDDSPETIPQHEAENIPIKTWRYADQAHDMVQDIHYSKSSRTSRQDSNTVISTSPPLQNTSQPDLHPYVRSLFCRLIPKVFTHGYLGYDLHVTHRYFFCNYCYTRSFAHLARHSNRPFRCLRRQPWSS